jgi:uncharacterized membrane protein
MIRGPTAVSTLLFALYPILIFAGLQFLDPRTVGAIVLATLLVRYRRNTLRLMADLSSWQWLALALPPLLGLAVIATNSETVLRLYPASISASMLLLFGATLLRPPTMVERFARLSHPELPPAAVRYTRQVTVVWCLFFAFNAAVAVYTAFAGSREAWALYNGFISYILMGILFAGERAVRRRVMHAA